MFLWFCLIVVRLVVLFADRCLRGKCLFMLIYFVSVLDCSGFTAICFVVSGWGLVCWLFMLLFELWLFCGFDFIYWLFGYLCFGCCLVV